jgi:hypothetical protein
MEISCRSASRDTRRGVASGSIVRVFISRREHTNNGLRNGRTFSFARNEWRTEESVRQQSHTRLEEPQKIKDHHAPRGQPQKMSMEARFLAERTADLVARLVPCKLLPEKQNIPFFFMLLWLIPGNRCIVRNYNRNYTSF